MLSITTEACALLNATRATVFAADRQNRQLFSLIASKQNEIKAETRAKTDSGLNRKYKPRRIVNKREFLTIRIPEDEGWWKRKRGKTRKKWRETVRKCVFGG
jgi:hypothetical protein